jgi:formylglycine-generating enzyme required for sulfatase activity
MRVVLRDFAAFAPVSAASRGTVSLFEAFLAASLAEAGCAEAHELLFSALRDGSALLLLDGLDEVVGQPVLQRVVESIADIGRTYRAPTLITCRVLDYYEEPERQIQGFERYTLAELDGEQIQQFITDWYRELAESGRRPVAQSADDAAALGQAVGSRGELRALAGTPLLLTVMALVHAFRGALPDARALLYAECVDLLLLRWRQPRGEPDLLERLGLSQFRSSDLLALMARLGYEAHAGADHATGEQAQPADLGEAHVMALLAEGFARYDEPRKYELAHKMLNALTKGNGLLLKRGPQVYTFAHRTFQEFLAGYHLKGQKDYRKLCLERADQPHWHEALTLMVGYQVLQDRELEKPLDLAEKLLVRSPIEQTLAGEVLVLIGRERALAYDPALLKLPDGLWPQARRRLLELLTRGKAPEAPAQLRARAGLALGLLCYGPVEELSRPAAQLLLPDPRLPLAFSLPMQRSPLWQKVLEHYWCVIEAGEFWSGDDRPKEEGSSGVKDWMPINRRTLRSSASTGRKTREPLCQAEIEHAYKIARYPLTNADFAQFIASGGYQERRWWTKQGWTYIKNNGRRYGRSAQNQIMRPALWGDGRYNNPSQPIVGVSWYEAAAYCQWLTVHGHTTGWLPTNKIIRLPTWHEWERAARHIDQRLHPWGNQLANSERANYADTGIGSPSVVGCFSAGVSVCGAHDMLGNVMEWTATKYQHPRSPNETKDFTPEDKVVLSFGCD